MPRDPARLPIVLVIGSDRQRADRIAGVLGASYELRRAYDETQAREFLDDDVDVVLVDWDRPRVIIEDLLVTRSERRSVCPVAQIVGPMTDVVALDTPVDEYLRSPIVPAVVRSTVHRLASVATYQRDLQELYTLARRKAAFESEMSRDELAASDEYAALLTEIDGYRELLDSMADGLDSRQLDLVLHDVQP